MKLHCPACQAKLSIPGETSLARKIHCPSCGEVFSLAASRRHVTVDEKTLLQSASWDRFELPPGDDSAPMRPNRPEAQDSSQARVAWERPSISLFSLWRTCVQVLTAPRAAFRPGSKSSLGRPFGFSAIMLLLALAPNSAEVFAGVGQGWTPFAASLALVLGPLAGAALILGLAWVQQLLLGAAKAGRGGFRATYRVMAYGQAFHILGVIIWAVFTALEFAGRAQPNLEGLFSPLPWLWGFAVLALGLSAAHKADFARVFVLLFFEAALILVGFLALML